MNYVGREQLLGAPLLREMYPDLPVQGEARTVAAPIATVATAEIPLLSVVVPFYNEEEMISKFFEATLPVLEGLDNLNFEIVCVNDGSRDSTLCRLLARSDADNRIRVIDLTRNFGKEAALSAGIDEAVGDILIPFDADLQDPPHVIRLLVEKWREGNDVVLARRSNRDSDSFLKRRTAAMFYRMHNAVCDTHIPENVGDFRLITREVANALKKLPETRRFMKGLFAWVGYRTAVVDYVRESRAAGQSKFSGWKLWNFALEGFTSFSTLPLRVWTYIGTAIAAIAFLYAGFLIVRTLIQGVAVPGYASILTVVLMLGGVQLIGIGVLGEYIGRIYAESKKRPVYLIKNRYQSAGASNA
ncbi:glycosyltransferase involved in cell wall biosynthesis [Paraburkholderia sp. GAS448]|uniref:glycosyltransferase family 2 protein n=1 Tax=Paraburkholderia sp. GAS448 TaxID=3035136 RepID=UPI003D1D3104